MEVTQGLSALTLMQWAGSKLPLCGPLGKLLSFCTPASPQGGGDDGSI